MTDLRQAAQQALEALIDAANVLSAPMFADAADALRKALEQPAPRPWQGLTDEDKQTAVWTDGTFGGGALWAQQLLKERNE